MIHYIWRKNVHCPRKFVQNIRQSRAQGHFGPLPAVWLQNNDLWENGKLFPGNRDPSSLTPGGPVVPLVRGFRRRYNLLAWRELFANLYELKSRIGYGRNKSASSKFKGYLDLTYFRQTSREDFKNNDERKWVGKFWYLKNLSHGVHFYTKRLEYF